MPAARRHNRTSQAPPTLKAIETHYKGFRFRSRLEARWAVFLDAADLSWSYEAEGYDLGEDGRYLPDFWIPELGCWLEIKGARPNPYDIKRVVSLALSAGRPVVVFQGEIAPDMMGGIATDAFYPKCYFWAGCGVCGWIDIIDYAARNAVNCPGCQAPRLFRASTPELRTAFDAARSARFEHGETP